MSLKALAADHDGLAIHPNREPSVTGILAMIETAASDGRLEDRLTEMCRVVSQITGMDVVSVYALEEVAGRGEALLVMRGNVGFPAGTVGRVELRVGEGITGMVAECMRTASVAVGYQQAQFKEVPGLPERDFPAFVAIPLRAGRGVCGVLVLQSRVPRQLSDAEVALATALAAPFAFALEAKRDAAERRPAALANRTAPISLHGVGASPGIAMGRAAMVPGLDMSSAPLLDAERLLSAAFVRVRRDLGRTVRRLGAAIDPALRSRLSQIELIFTDSRMESAMRTEAVRGGIAAACYRVALRYAHTPYRTESDAPPEWLIERSREREALCVLLRCAALGDEPLQRGSAVLVGRLTAVITLAAIARGVTALAIESAVGSDALGIALARAAGVPVVTGVAGVLSSVSPGDRVIVDADSGIIRARPTANEIARIRNGKYTLLR